MSDLFQRDLMLGALLGLLRACMVSVCLRAVKKNANEAGQGEKVLWLTLKQGTVPLYYFTSVRKSNYIMIIEIMIL